MGWGPGGAEGSCSDGRRESMDFMDIFPVFLGRGAFLPRHLFSRKKKALTHCLWDSNPGALFPFMFVFLILFVLLHFV